MTEFSYKEGPQRLELQLRWFNQHKLGLDPNCSTVAAIATAKEKQQPISTLKSRRTLQLKKSSSEARMNAWRRKPFKVEQLLWQRRPLLLRCDAQKDQLNVLEIAMRPPVCGVYANTLNGASSWSTEDGAKSICIVVWWYAHTRTRTHTLTRHGATLRVPLFQNSDQRVCFRWGTFLQITFAPILYHNNSSGASSLAAKTTKSEVNCTSCLYHS